MYDNETNNLSANDPVPETIDKPPVITLVASSVTSSSSATITWTTNKISDSEVKYGTTSGDYSDTASEATDVKSHSIGLTGLSASTKYYYVVNSTSPGDNTNQSAEYSFTTSAAARRSVGGGGGTTTTTTTTGETTVSTEPTGEVKSTVTATSTDAKASATISAETIAKDAAGSPLTSVTVTQPSALPAGAPSGANYVGYAYTFGPEGAKFSKPVTISITFDPAKYEGKTPVIHTYEAGAWKALATTVVGNKATATVTHFSTFVLFAAEEVITPTPTPTPTPKPTPTATPSPTPTPTPEGPGFEAVFAIAGLLAVAYLVLRRKRK